MLQEDDFLFDRKGMANPGFGEFEVPEMPHYAEGYSKRGNTFDADVTPVFMQTRFGNREGHGIGAYALQAEDRGFLEGSRLRRGNPGTVPLSRWDAAAGPPGMSRLSVVANHAGVQTRGDHGGPRRAVAVERPGAWFERARFDGGLVQPRDNYVGVFDSKRRTPLIQRQNDMLVLQPMIEHNPFHVRSHAAAAAKRAYDAELGRG